MFTFRSARRKPGWLSIQMGEGQVTLVHVLRRPGVRPGPDSQGGRSRRLRIF